MARSFIPALGRDFLTPAYDVLIRLTLPELRFKRKLLDAAAITPHMTVLDVGAGTGTLLFLAKEREAAARFVGLDADARIIRIAQRKTAGQCENVAFLVADAVNIPMANECVDRVVSTLAVHHLGVEAKYSALRECFRVLRPGGEIHVGDFGAPAGPYTRVASFLVQHLGGEPVAEHFRGQIPSMLAEAGFTNVRETGAFPSVFGVIRNVAALKV